MQEKTLKIWSATSEIQRKSEVLLPIFSGNPKYAYLFNLFFVVELRYIAIRCPLLAHGQLPVKHCLMILAIRQRQLCCQRHINLPLLMMLWQSLRWFQVT